MKKIEDSSTLSWDAVAKDWVRHADQNDYRIYFLLPLTLEWLGDVKGAHILDLGCGEGGYSRELAVRGAKVVGVDGSAQLVATAEQTARAAGLQIEYICANASSLEPIAPASFEIVLASMVLMDVEDYPGAIEEIWRILVPDGRLLMSITHPCFSSPTSEWVRTESAFRIFFSWSGASPAARLILELRGKTHRADRNRVGRFSCKGGRKLNGGGHQ
ncbi:MAG: class I SAM-dependent methyltransferase [Acidobacteriia bacterium]|nr:class I SAM-dependent methyltransferase [Terriglobia bacterium]